MRKLTLFFAMLVASVGMFAKTVYLVPNANWKVDNARFAVYMYGNGDAWADMTLVAGEANVYSATVDETKFTTIIFCRMNPATTENKWDNRWNQTNDLTLDATNDLYTIAEGAWDKGAGTWSVYKSEEITLEYNNFFLDASGWGYPDAVYYAWYWGIGVTDAWTETFKAVEGKTGLYEMNIPKGATDWIVVRANPAVTKGWDAEWNRAQIALPTDSGKTTYTITGWGETICEGDVCHQYATGTWDEVKRGVTYKVVVPEGTPDCYIVGNMNGWSFQQMTKVDDSHYTITIDNAMLSDAYKYTCGASWDYEELTAEGYSVQDRSWSEQDTVAKWKNIPSTVVTDVFTVAGSSEAVFGTLWDAANTANDMSEMTIDGVTGYVLMKQNVELKAKDTIQWKVVKNHSWDVSYGDTNNNNDNYQYIITEDGKYNVVFIFMEIAGLGHMAEATFEPVDSTATVYYVAGNKELTGYNWAPDSLAMMDGAIILQNVPAGTHAFKITDGQWNSAEDNTHEFTTLDSSCVSPNVTHDAYGNITFTTDKVQNIAIAIVNNKVCVVVEAVEVKEILTVAGNAVYGDNWDITNTDNEMQLVDGLYTLVVTGVTLEKGHKIEYKIIKGHSWDNEEVFPKTGSNAVYEITEETAVYTVTYIYNPLSGAVSIQLEKTGDAAPITHVYSIVGDFFSWGWEPANAPEMTKVNDSIYTYQIDTFAITAAPDTLYYKLTADHQWGVYELPAQGDYNYIFNRIGSYQLNFTANIASHYVALDATLLNTDTAVVETKYYVAGTMNDWAANGTEIVDGTVTFKDLEPGLHAFKVTDGQWNSDTETGHEFTTIDTECTSEGVTGGNGQNIVFTTGTKQDVTITFDGTRICVKVVTGEAPKVYYVVGDEALTGKNWLVNNAEAALVNGTITFKDVAAGAHAFKITDGQWNSDTETGHEFTTLDTECSSKGVTGGNGGNIEFATYKVQDITIAMDLTTFAICVTADTERPQNFEDTYVIAGDSALMGIAWSGTAEQNKMTVQNNEATLVIDSVRLKAGTYYFKVVKNGGQWIPGGTGNDSQLQISQEGDYKVTFTYVLDSERATAVAELIGKPIDVTYYYYIMGEFSPWGWDDDGTAEKEAMTLKSEGIYEYTISAFKAEAKTYQYKLREGNSWVDSYQLPASGNAEYTFTEAGEYDLVFTADVVNHTITLVATKTGDNPQVVDYYLFGYINGADYGCEGDYLNMGDYKFVEGALSATFTQTSYVAVKTTDNAAWYMTDGYPGDGAVSAVLYNTQTLGDNADKLPVPANVEVNFTLVVNDNGTLTLSYTTGNTGSGLENIEEVLNVNAPMYNVLGQKVDASYKGIIIQNGKKYLRR